MDQETPLQPSRRWRWILLFLLLALSSSGVFWGVATEAGVRVLLPWMVDLFSGTRGFEIRLGEIRGTLVDGVEIASLTGSLSPARLSFSASSLRIQVAPHWLLTGRLKIPEIVCCYVRVSGPPPAEWIELLPPLPPPPPSFGCFLLPGTKVEIDRIKIERLEWAPTPDGLKVLLADFDLGVPSIGSEPSRGGIPAPEHPVKCQGLATWYGRELLNTGLVGSCSNRLSTLFLEGTLAGHLLGVPLKNEMRARVGKDGAKLDGFLEATTVDLASVSRLFEPFWTPVWPLLRATGTARLSGSWLFDPRLGFQGNLRGGLERVGGYLAGLNLSILELTAEIVIRQDEVMVSDRGSHFCGMPATLQGTLSWSPGLPPGGNLVLEVPDFRPGEFIASFPWLVRKGMGWPDILGSAALKLQMVGRPASLLGNLVTEELMIEKGGMVASLAGRLTFRHDAGKGPEWRSTFRWRCPDSVPAIVERLEEQFPTGLRKPSSPIHLEISCVGGNPSSLDVEGRLSWNGAEVPIEGRLVEGRLEQLKADPHRPHFLGGGVFLSDLALLSGW